MKAELMLDSETGIHFREYAHPLVNALPLTWPHHAELRLDGRRVEAEDVMEVCGSGLRLSSRSSMALFLLSYTLGLFLFLDSRRLQL